MKDVKILGPGCKRCETTEAMVKDAAAKLGVDMPICAAIDQVLNHGAAIDAMLCVRHLHGYSTLPAVP